MDPAQLAQSVGGFVAPFVPYLLKAGEKAAEEAGEKMGGDAWERARALWGRLQGRRAVEAAARDLADRPHDPDAQAALRLQLKKLLAEDQALAREVAELWAEIQAAGVTATASGERSVAIAGDRNVVQQGKYNVHVGRAQGLAIGDGARVVMSTSDEPVDEEE